MSEVRQKVTTDHTENTDKRSRTLKAELIQGQADLEENRSMILLIRAIGAIRGLSLMNRVSPLGVMPIGRRPEPPQCVTLV